MRPTFLAGIAFDDWWRVLRDNRFAVRPGMWPSAAGITAMSLYNSLTRRAEARLSCEHDPVAPIFIVGHWRSGTTHLHNLLACDPQLAAPSTYQVAYPGSFLRCEARHSRWLAPFVPATRPQDNMAMSLSAPNEDEIALAAMGMGTPYLACHFPARSAHYWRYLTLADLPQAEVDAWCARYRQHLRRLHRHHEGRTLLLKSPAHTGRVRLLRRLYPQARFVHIHRDPVRTVQSTLHLHQTWQREMAVFQRIEAPDNLAVVLQMYEEMMRAFFTDAAELPAQQLHTLSFEQLEADPVAVLREIYQRWPDLQLPEAALRDYLNSLDGYQKNHYPAPDPVLCARVKERLGFVYRGLGRPVHDG